MKNKREIVLRQIELQEKIQSAGFNIVECGNCGCTLLHELGDEDINCFCGETMALSDCADLYYSGMENNAEFESAEKVKNEDLENYLETHFDVVAFINYQLETYVDNQVYKRHEAQGSGGMYLLAKQWTDEFTEKYKNIVWGEELEYYDTLEEFLNNKNK